MEEVKMTNEQAATVIAFHLMQCGMLMPVSWVRDNGEGSEFQQAVRIALDSLKPKKAEDNRSAAIRMASIGYLRNEALEGRGIAFAYVKETDKTHCSIIEVTKNRAVRKTEIAGSISAPGTIEADELLAVAKVVEELGHE